MKFKLKIGADQMKQCMFKEKLILTMLEYLLSIFNSQVKLNVYITYAKSIGMMSSLLVLGLYFLFQVFAVFGNIWLSWWAEDRLADKSPKANGTEPESKLDIYLGVYGGLGIAQGKIYR